MEIIINDGLVSLDGEILPNAGWHTHFHVILFVPKDKFGTVSDMEAQMDRVKIVAAQFEEESGEGIDSSYMPTFEAYGLHLSRYNKGERKGELRLLRTVFIRLRLKIMTICTFTASIKKSRRTLSRIVDLWTEYAIATKGLPALQFLRPLIKKINEYFIAHMDFEILRLFYRNFLIPQLRQKAAEGYVKKILPEASASKII